MTVVARRPFGASCRHYNGYKPCGYREDCTACPDYHSRSGRRILIVKLGALGDVLRTTPLIRGLKDRSPDCEIVWLTSPGASGLPQEQPVHRSALDRRIDRPGPAPGGEVRPGHLPGQGPGSGRLRDVGSGGSLLRFWDEPVRPDHPLEPGLPLLGSGWACPTSSSSAKTKRSTRPSASSRPSWTGPARTTSSTCPAEDQAAVDEFLAPHLAGADKIIGFNLGGGDVFANKRWKLGHYLALRGLIQDRWGDKAAVLVMGGPPDGRPDGLFFTRLFGSGGGYGPYQLLSALRGVAEAVRRGHHRRLVGACTSPWPWGRPAWSWSARRPTGSWSCTAGARCWSRTCLAPPCYGRSCDKDPDCMSSFTPEMILDRLIALIG